MTKQERSLGVCCSRLMSYTWVWRKLRPGDYERERRNVAFLMETIKSKYWMPLTQERRDGMTRKFQFVETLLNDKE